MINETGFDDTFYYLEKREYKRKQQFINSVNGDGSKTVNHKKVDITQHHIDI